MKKLSVLAAALLVLSGCASVRNQPIDQKTSEAVKGKSVVYVTRSVKPDFAAMTAEKVMIPIVGAALMISEGNDIVAKNSVPDPAEEIAAALAQALQASHGVKVGAGVPVTGSDIDKLMGSTEAQYVIDVETINWMFAYFPTDWKHYRVGYTAKARLIDTQTKDVVAEGACSQFPDQTPTSPSYDELLADGARRLKNELAAAASFCIESFKKNTLKLNG